jgi:nitroreductase
MPTPNPAALDFLLTRRSRPAKTLTLPVPGDAELMTILTAAARSPDHGMLTPWRFVVLEKGAMHRLAALVSDRGAALGYEGDLTAKGRGQFETGNLAVVVVASPKASDKIPGIEQTLSAGAVCLALVNAALASGWGASWITGWPAHDRGFVEKGLGLAPQELVAGIVHIGTETTVPSDRPRPDLAALTTWMRA